MVSWAPKSCIWDRLKSVPGCPLLFPCRAGFFVSCTHTHAELVSSSTGRFVIWISGSKLFTVEYIQASLHFLRFNMLLTVGWLKASLSKWKLFLLCSPFPLPQTHGHLAYAECSPCRACQPADKAGSTRVARAATTAVNSVKPLVSWSNVQIKWFLWQN